MCVCVCVVLREEMLMDQEGIPIVFRSDLRVEKASRRSIVIIFYCQYFCSTCSSRRGRFRLILAILS